MLAGLSAQPPAHFFASFPFGCIPASLVPPPCPSPSRNTLQRSVSPCCILLLLAPSTTPLAASICRRAGLPLELRAAAGAHAAASAPAWRGKEQCLLYHHTLPAVPLCVCVRARCRAPLPSRHRRPVQFSVPRLLVSRGSRPYHAPRSAPGSSLTNISCDTASTTSSLLLEFVFEIRARFFPTLMAA